MYACDCVYLGCEGYDMYIYANMVIVYTYIYIYICTLVQLFGMNYDEFSFLNTVLYITCSVCAVNLLRGSVESY